MKRIYKYPLHIEVQNLYFPNDEGATPEVRVQMPAGAQLLHIALQGDSLIPMLWALVNPDAPKGTRRIGVVMTGEQLFDNFGTTNAGPHSAPYLGTLQYINGKFIAHFFDLGELVE